MPFGKKRESSFIFSLTALETATALPVDESWMAIAALGWPFRRLVKL